MTHINFNLGIDDVEGHLERSQHYLVGDMLRKNARTRPDDVAIVGEDGDQLTYDELDRRVNGLANALLDRGIDHGSRIAVLSENRPAFAEAILAGAKIGALVSTMNWRQQREELLHCLDAVDVDVLLISERQAEKRGWVAESDLSPDLIAIDGGDWGASYESLINRGADAEPSPSRPPSPEDGVTVFYTSGTTGLPKGTVISHRAMIYRAIGWKLVSNVGPDYIAWAPMFHQVSTEQLFSVLMDGGTYYPVDGFDPDTLLDRLATAECGYFVVMPGTLQPLLDRADEKGFSAEDFPTVDYVGVMADLVAARRIERITELFDAKFLNSFGLTETSVVPLSGNAIPAGTAPTKDDLSKREGPLCDVKLIDEDWNEVATGEYGELAVRGPTLFSGYIGNREANTAEFYDGWFRTGDMFIRNENGTYDFVDRRKYLIKSGGENIYPAEIERVLMDQPEISEAIVVRVPDDDWGEVPKAYIARNDGWELTREEILERLEGRIARYKLPHYIDFVDQDKFPRSTTGKIVRSEVEEWPIDEDERVRNPLDN